MLTELPKVGDKVRYLGRNYSYMTVGEEYEVRHVVSDLFEIKDDEGDVLGFDHDDFHRFELVERAEPTSPIFDLIANLARRVSELEACLSVEQAHREDLTEQNAQQAYEINELYRAFVRKEAQI